MSLHPKSYMRRVGRYGVYFVMPALAFFIAFNFFPMLYAIGVSFFDYDLITEPVFVGFSNYRNILSDPVFWRSFKATGVYVFWTDASRDAYVARVRADETTPQSWRRVEFREHEGTLPSREYHAIAAIDGQVTLAGRVHDIFSAENTTFAFVARFEY